MKKREKSGNLNKEILSEHYPLDEICEMIGYYDGSNSDSLPMERLLQLELTDYKAFEDLILDHAIVNGNFEDVLLCRRNKPRT